METISQCELRERIRGIDGQLDLVGGWIDAAFASGDYARSEELLNRHNELARQRRKLLAAYESAHEKRPAPS